ncbi:hypothetical protein HAX54_018145, partial [Datura stramonium]|nr:hypothetical protein [Datura stramonium]
FWNEGEEIGLRKVKIEIFNTTGHTSAASSEVHCHASATRGTWHRPFNAMQCVAQQEFGAMPCARRRPSSRM